MLKIKEKTVNRPPAEGGITLYPYIFYFCKDEPSQRLRDHERVRDQGWSRFYPRYLWGLRKGYHSVEAARGANR